MRHTGWPGSPRFPGLRRLSPGHPPGGLGCGSGWLLARHDGDHAALDDVELVAGVRFFEELPAVLFGVLGEIAFVGLADLEREALDPVGLLGFAAVRGATGGDGDGALLGDIDDVAGVLILEDLT